MSHWIFQGNPDVFDIDTYLREKDEITWTVRQRHLADQIKVDDEVFLWRAAGRQKGTAGIVAVAKVVEEPKDDVGDDALELWSDQSDAGPELRVRLRVISRHLGAKEIVKRDWVKEDPVLSGLRILRFASETNYLVRPQEAHRLAILCKNTGRDWSREECVAGLWAYKQTKDREVSRLAGEPVAVVALTIGRAVSGVYNKVMNFRYIDPDDRRKGLSSTNRLDHETWKEFYDPQRHGLDTARLDAEYRRIWSRRPTDMPADAKPIYRDYGEAPDDNLDELQRFAARVRKGQPKFRQKLLALYDNKCAMTGTGPAVVLEATHIWPHAQSGINQSDNGLLLRADIHTLFDAGLLRIHPDTVEIQVDPSLKDTAYWSLSGHTLRERHDGKRPRKGYLQKRWESSGT